MLKVSPKFTNARIVNRAKKAAQISLTEITGFTEFFGHELHEWTLMFLCSIIRANS